MKSAESVIHRQFLLRPGGRSDALIVIPTFAPDGFTCRLHIFATRYAQLNT